MCLRYAKIVCKRVRLGKRVKLRPFYIDIHTCLVVYLIFRKGKETVIDYNIRIS
jgi:hypothetical protein